MNYVAIDLGASSGRVVLGRWDGARFHVEVLHRFANEPLSMDGRWHWDAQYLWAEVKSGLKLLPPKVAGIGVDTWGLDFGLLDGEGRLLGAPYAYRDPHTVGMPEQVFEHISRREMFAITGVESMRVNTLYQLWAMQRNRDPRLLAAETLLMMPDLFRYWLTGHRAVEYTIASTTQMLDAVQRSWAMDLLRRLDLAAARLLPPLIALGTIVGPVSADVGVSADTPVIAVAGHDTACAVAAVPSLDENSAFISCGTWSLMGVETSAPVLTDEALRLNFSNEGGVAGTIRLQKNMTGLWLLQESQRQWQREGCDYSWPQLLALAEQAAPFGCVIDPDAPGFSTPGDMPANIREYCAKTGQRPPESIASVVRCCLEGLALRSRWVAESLERLMGRRLHTIRMVGGGCQNTLLCQFTADACQRPLVAGPVEATALGNLIIQAIATGALPDLASARAIISKSVDTRTYEPGEGAPWDAAFQRFCAL